MIAFAKQVTAFRNFCNIQHLHHKCALSGDLPPPTAAAAAAAETSLRGRVRSRPVPSIQGQEDKDGEEDEEGTSLTGARFRGRRAKKVKGLEVDTEQDDDVWICPVSP